MMRPLKSFWTPPWMPFLAQRQKLQWKFWTQKEVFFLILILKSEAVLARCGCSLSTASVRDNAFTSKCLISCQESPPRRWRGPFILLSASCGVPPAKNCGFRKATSQCRSSLWFFFSSSPTRLLFSPRGKQCWWESIDSDFSLRVWRAVIIFLC